MPAALVLAKEPSIERLVGDTLRHAGYEVVTVSSAEEALKVTLSVRVSSVIIDTAIGADDMDAVADWVRSRAEDVSGIVFLMSVRTRPASLPIVPEQDELVAKPFTPEQVRLAVERAATAAQRNRPDVLRIGGTELDRRNFEIRDGDVAITVSATEFRLIEYLAQQGTRWVSAGELAEKVWERAATDRSTATVRSHVQNVRKKLTSLPQGQDLIENWAGRGYRLRAQ